MKSTPLSTLPPATIALGLAALMAGTRFHDVGSALHLVDASLAVFYLGGLYLRRNLAFGLFLAEAALIDYVAITLAGTSDYCVTPAYAFLLPTYAVMWFSGAAFAQRAEISGRTLAALSAVLLASTLVAFGISNGSFYAFSDYFPDMSWQQYWSSTLKYLPTYAGSTVAYVAAAVSAQIFARSGLGRAGV